MKKKEKDKDLEDFWKELEKRQIERIERISKNKNSSSIRCCERVDD